MVDFATYFTPEGKPMVCKEINQSEAPKIVKIRLLKWVTRVKV